MNFIIANSIRLLLILSAWLATFPYAEAQTANTDASSLAGKVMVGYQGWFNCEGDGSDLGWAHWTRNRRKPLGPGNVSVDLWPDVSECDADELFETGFKHQDGSVANVFSSANQKTVLRHFRWMRDYEIDGAFVQRFAVNLSSPALLRNNDTVLSHVRQGARESGRVVAVMYDLSGLKAGQVERIRSDWSRLQSELKVTQDPGYLHHKGKPLVAVWGIGFNDNRPYSLQECFDLVKRLKSDGCSVMLGVPSFWREGKRDSIDDPLLHAIIREADIVSPWSVGRYRNPDEAFSHATNVWQRDREWCIQSNLEFLPVVFPGFSWHNLQGGKLDQIPRLKGEFLWSQVTAAKKIGSNMIYVAMFDEVDEATAIFKCADNPPSSDDAKFVGYEGLPSDFYLKVTGQAGKLLRDEPGAVFPAGAPDPGQRPTEITNSIGMKLVRIPAGSFMMGSPTEEEGRQRFEQLHRVTDSNAYYLGAYEVTQGQYEKVMGNNPSHFKGRELPVETVSWDDAISFCKKLSELPDEKIAGREYRLPTEAEWEYACRATSDAAYCFGDSAKSLREYAWYGEGFEGKSHQVGEKKANQWGLYDMHGNVWEWCHDRFGNYPSGEATDPQGPSEGADRICRGPSFVHGAEDCRSAHRGVCGPTFRESDIGFRVALISLSVKSPE